MNWDDLPVIAAVIEEGTFAAASQRLRVDETTVARRLARIERALGLRLFEAMDGVRRPTPQCEAIVAHVQAMARHVGEIAKVGENMAGPVGSFRIASTTAIAEDRLSPGAGAFLAAHPGLALHFLTSSENVNFSRWEADLAIRLRKPEKGDFSISKLAELPFCLIEPESEAAGPPIVCSYPSELDHTPESHFLKARGLERRARCVTDNVRVIRNLVRSGRAIGVLPERLCEALQAEGRFRVTPVPQRRTVWLLVQNHLKRDPAARVVIDWVRGCFQDADRT